jgi:hypothetical protein
MDKVLENRLRRAAERRGLVLQKSRRRDPDAVNYGGYMIVDPRTGMVLSGANPAPYSLSLAEAARILGERWRPAPTLRPRSWVAHMREMLPPIEALVAEMRRAGVTEADKSEEGKILRGHLKWLELMRRGLDGIEAEDPSRFYSPLR